MEVVVVDGQGGGIGRSVCQILKQNFDDVFIIGVGTNATASTNLKKGGADVIATGENAIVYNVTRAKIVIGPLGIAFANSMYGEISPAIAMAVSQSEGTKYLIPISQCKANIVGVKEQPIADYLEELVEIMKK